MPKSTFYNLNNEKREKIKKALKNEFTRNTFEKASISNIIEEAQIPRGSFYQYFEDKEDALKYIIENFLNDEKKQIERLLIQNEGNIFSTTLDLYSYFVDKNYNESEIKLFQNIINKLRNENVNIFKDIKQFKDLRDIDKTNCYINTNMLNIENEKDIEYMLRIITCILRAEIIDVMHKKVSKEKRKRGINQTNRNLKKRNDKIIQNFQKNMYILYFL